MTSVYDVILRVSFKVSFPHLYVLEVVLQKVIFSCVRAIFFFLSIKKKDTFVKTLF